MASATPEGRDGPLAVGRRRLSADAVVVDGTSGSTARRAAWGVRQSRILSCKIQLNLPLEATGTGGDRRRRSIGSVREVFLPKEARTEVAMAASQLAGRPRNAANRRGLGTRLITIIASSVTIPARAWHSRLLPVIRTPDIEFIIQWPRA